MNKFILADINLEMVERWRHHFGMYKNVEFHHGDVFQKSADILVSPAKHYVSIKSYSEVICSKIYYCSFIIFLPSSNF